MTTSSVYISVIEDVINKVREEFINNGPGEDVLKELQGTWEAKMMAAGVVSNPIERTAAARGTPGTAPVHDLNVPYEGTEEYETPTAEILFPPTPLQTPIPATPIQTPLPGTADNSYNIPTGGSDYSANESGSGNTELKAGRPSPYMQPPSPWMNNRPPLDVNIAYVEGREEVDRGAAHQPPTQDFFQMNSGKRKREEFAQQYQAGGFIPQQDGAGDVAPEVFEIEVSGGSTSIGRHAFGEMLTRMRSTPKIPQLDGPIPDPYDDVLSTPNIYNYQGGGFNEDYNVANTPTPIDLPVSTPAPVVQNDTEENLDDDEPPLNENDDDDLEDENQENMAQPLVLAQFDKVTRTKSRWKCTLKDGIMHINNKDILFNKVNYKDTLFSKATGEFDF